MKRLWLVCGVLAPVFYVATVIIGGAITPDYSHVRDAISSLTETGAPEIPLIQIGFALYNWSLLAFSLGLMFAMWKAGSRSMVISAGMLMLVGLAGVLMSWFTQDPVGTPLTVRGIGHFVLAGIEALGTIIGILLFGLGSRRISGLAPLRLYSLLSAAVVFISGGISSATLAFNPYFGVFERITIGTFMLWLFVVSTRLLRLSGAPAQRLRVTRP